jgi:hypothetical protein
MSAPVVPILFGGLMAWGIYRRVRRNIGRQRLRPVRSVISIVVLSLVSVVLFVTALHQSRLLLGIGGGMGLGVVLGFVGLRLTRFETTDEGHFYTPDTRIGLALSLLFVGRLIYRFWVMRDPALAAGHPQPFQSPLTFLIFGLVAGYSLVYYIGLFVHAHDQKRLAAAD